MSSEAAVSTSILCPITRTMAVLINITSMGIIGTMTIMLVMPIVAFKTLVNIMAIVLIRCHDCLGLV